ncbi:DNA-binding protein [Rathayibacter caricis DSM 15933]|uniref:DNA-binding protein n=1 Tax=Rathayibacter caricis DSM 15933 TaxID=1328867 RepID=A0A2T4UPD4_9MICO|nr:nucleotidyltransferase domain-containing protein [Rathayibacter caricis]PTL71396.1 DNA-binding protein [Rathayibacter caricis DSM 15933]
MPSCGAPARTSRCPRRRSRPPRPAPAEHRRDRSRVATPEPGTARASPPAARLRPSIVLEYLADDVRQLAADHGLSDVRVFGSAARGSDDERSDIDLLAAADPSIDFLRLAAFRGRAEELLGFPVDVVIDSPDDDVVAAIRREAVPL